MGRLDGVIKILGCPFTTLSSFASPLLGSDRTTQLRTTKQIDPDIPVILFTGFGTIESAVYAMKLGAYDYIQKPFSPEMMEIILNKAIEFRKLKRENVALKKANKGNFAIGNGRRKKRSNDGSS